MTGSLRGNELTGEPGRLRRGGVLDARADFGGDVLGQPVGAVLGGECLTDALPLALGGALADVPLARIFRLRRPVIQLSREQREEPDRRARIGRQAERAERAV